MTLPAPIRDLPPLPDPNLSANRQALNHGPAKDTVLDAMSVTELLDLRTQVEQRLPVKDLKDLDLSRELVLQLLAVQQLQNEVIQDVEVPTNQRAQTAGQVASTLAALIKLQESVFTSERLKRVEQVLISTLQTLPTKAQEEFFVAYELALGGA